MGEGHNHVRSIFEHWRRLEDGKREIADDLKDLFSEAKSHGFDTKALRAAFRQVVKDEERSADDDEHDALVGTYMAAIQGHARPAPARVEIVEEIAPHDAEAGELVEAAETDPRAKASEGNGATGEPEQVAADSVSGDASRPSRGGGTPATIPLEEPDLPAFLDRRGRP